MRILVNAVGARMGGATRHLVPFLTALALARPAWELLVCVARGDQGAISDVRGVESVEVTGSNTISRLRWDAVGAAAVAKRRRVDAILSLTNYGPLAPGRPSVIFQRNSIYFDPLWIRRAGYRHAIVAHARRRLAYAELARSSAVVTPSRAMLSYLEAWSDATLPPYARVIPHAVDSKRFAFAHPGLTTPRRGATLLVVSHAAPHKGVETAISCVAHLLRAGVEADLLLTIAREGNGPAQSYVDRLQRLAGSRIVRDRIHWLGPQGSVERLYHEADVLLFPSLSESFGFPLLEAMSSGTAIVATAIASSMELAGSSARYFDLDDGAMAAAQVVSLLQQDPRAAFAGALQARSRAESMSWERNAEAVASLLEDVNDAARPR